MTMVGCPRASIAIMLLAVSMLHLTNLSDSFATTVEEPHKTVWGKVMRLEPNHVVIVKNPAGLEVTLHGDVTTVAGLRPGELVKALVDRDGRIVFIESVAASDQAEPHSNRGGE